jgi:hypothetical protein
VQHEREPALRASLLKLYLRHLAATRPEDGAAARRALGADAAARIERTPGHEWLPLSLEVTILGAIHERHGDDTVLALGRELGLAAMDDTILRPLVRATLTMLGRRPDVLLHLALAGWRVATRDAGRVAIARRADGEVDVAVEDMPPVMRERALLLRMAGSTEALLRSIGVTARSQLVWEPGASRAEIRLTWARGG